MSVLSALKITGILLLVASSLVDVAQVQASNNNNDETYNRAIRSQRRNLLATTAKRTRGIGGIHTSADHYPSRSSSSSSKSTKSGKKSKGKGGKGGNSNSSGSRGKGGNVVGRADVPHYSPTSSSSSSSASTIASPTSSSSSSSSSTSTVGSPTSSSSSSSSSSTGTVGSPTSSPVGSPTPYPTVSPTSQPTVDPNEPDHRIPVIVGRPVEVPAETESAPEDQEKPSFWYPRPTAPETGGPQDGGSDLEGRNDLTTTGNDNQESQIEVVVDNGESLVQDEENADKKPSDSTETQVDEDGSNQESQIGVIADNGESETQEDEDGGNQVSQIGVIADNGESSVQGGDNTDEKPSDSTETQEDEDGGNQESQIEVIADNGESVVQNEDNTDEKPSDSTETQENEDGGNQESQIEVIVDNDESSVQDEDNTDEEPSGSIETQENGDDSLSDAFNELFDNIYFNNNEDKNAPNGEKPSIDSDGENANGPSIGAGGDDVNTEESSDGFEGNDIDNGGSAGETDGHGNNGESDSNDGTVSTENESTVGDGNVVQDNESSESGSSTGGWTPIGGNVVQGNENDESGSITDGDTSGNNEDVQGNQNDASKESGSNTDGEDSVDGTPVQEKENDASDEHGSNVVDGNQSNENNESGSDTGGWTQIVGNLVQENGNNENNGSESTTGGVTSGDANVIEENQNDENNGSESTTGGVTSGDANVIEGNQNDKNNGSESNTGGVTSGDANVIEENQNDKNNGNDSTTGGVTSGDGNDVDDSNSNSNSNENETNLVDVVNQTVEVGGKNDEETGKQVDGGEQGENVDPRDEDESPSDAAAAVFCPDVSPDKEVLINWIYAVEFSPDMTPEEKTEAVTIMELELVSEILKCNTPVSVSPGKRFIRNRNLVQDDGIAGLNYMPLDAKNDEVVCFTNSTVGGVCETYFGRMEMYLQEDADEQNAMKKMLHSIRETMQRKNDFPSAEGIAQVWYLDPEINDVSEIAGDPDPWPKPAIEESFSTGTMIAFAALGAFVFAALIMGVFRMRRSYHDGVSTLEPGSSLGCSGMTAQNESYGGKPPCSFAAMLPNSYKLEESDGMSAIPEADSDCESRYNDCSVIVSDGGYTSDGSSRAGDAFAPQTFDPVLGAHQLDEDNLDTDRDLLFENTENYDEIHGKFESGREFSEHRKKHLVTGEDVSLGMRHSTVDVHQCTSASCKICNYKPNDVEFIHNSPHSPDLSTNKFFSEMDEASTEKEV